MNDDEARQHARRGRRMSRRGFIVASGGIAVASGAAALIAYRGDRQRTRATPVAPAPRQPVGTRGGVLRVYNFNAMPYDSPDPHLTQTGSIANLHSAIYSRLLRYSDEHSGTIAPDLAEALPEQPDATTYVFQIREGVTFHDTPAFRKAFPKTAGRNLTAEDVKASIERQLNAGSPQAKRFARASNWSVIDKIDARDARRLAITTKTPVAPFLNFLAGRHAFVMPIEVIETRDEITNTAALIGSGPFHFDSFDDGVAVRVRRNASWFAREDSPGGIGTGRPFLDGYDAFLTPQEDAFERAAFERRIVDATGFTDSATLDQERKTNLADIVLDETDAGGILAGRLLLDRAPFNDDRVRHAVHLALDRDALLALLYPAMDGRASAKLTGAVAPVMSRFAITNDELRKRPGYRSDAAGRDEDIRTAKQNWSAAMGARPITDLRIFFAGIPKLIPEKAAEAIRAQLAQVLGVNVIVQTDASGQVIIGAAYRRNIEGATDGVATFTFGFEDGGVDLDDWLYPQFRSGQPLNTYRLQDAQLDALLDKSRAEFDADARVKLGLDAQDYLLAKVNARLEICAPIERRLSWGYLRNYAMPLWYGADQSLADTWIDTTHPAWRTR
jgi:ABC-type transport system substrate-binding protein